MIRKVERKFIHLDAYIHQRQQWQWQRLRHPLTHSLVESWAHSEMQFMENESNKQSTFAFASKLAHTHTTHAHLRRMDSAVDGWSIYTIVIIFVCDIKMSLSSRVITHVVISLMSIQLEWASSWLHFTLRRAKAHFHPSATSGEHTLGNRPFENHSMIYALNSLDAIFALRFSFVSSVFC